MSLKFFHSVIVVAAIAVALCFAAWCFFSPDVASDPHYRYAGIGAVVISLALVGYEIYFLRKTRRLILS